MARAHRIAIVASAFIVVYLLALFAVLPLPFLDPDVVAQLLHVVRTSLPSWLMKPIAEILDPLVVARVFRRLLPRVSRLGSVYVPGLSRRLSRVARGAPFYPKRPLTRGLTTP